MKISVIVTSFNSEKFLKFSINSILSQTHQDFEIIIVDDCSKDKTREIINKFQKKDKRIKAILLKKNTGTAAIPRNIGAKLAKSKYLCWFRSFFNCALFFYVFYCFRYSFAVSQRSQWRQPGNLKNI